jgi:low affinity Fe/Cu permease
VKESFRQVAAHVSRLAGSPPVFLLAASAIGLSGWHYSFSEAWESHTTFIVSIATFLMIFLLQNSENIHAKATHLKLDELIHAVEGARNEVTKAEEKAEHEIEALRQPGHEE